MQTALPLLAVPMWACLCLVGSPRAHAEGLVGSPQAQAKGLTLARAIELADQRHEAPQVAEARLRQARAARRSAYAALLPTLQLSATYNRRAREVIREVAGGDDIVIQRKNALSAAGRAQLALFDPGAFPLIAAAGHEVDAAAAELREARRTLWLDVAEAFFAVLAAEQVEQAAQERVGVAEVEAQAASRRLEAGLAGRNTLTRSRLELEAARLSLVQARSAITHARLSLGFLIDSEVPERLVETPGPVIEQLPERKLVERALGLRDDLRAARAATRAADARADEPWTRHLPSLDASAVTTWTNEAGLRGRDTDWTIAVTATWIAYDGGLRYAQAEARSAELAELRLRAAALEREVRLQVQTALADLSSAGAAHAVAQASVEAAQQNLEEVRARFERGLSDVLALADANEQAFLAAAELSGQRLSLRLAELDLLRATGRWPNGSEGPRREDDNTP